MEAVAEGWVPHGHERVRRKTPRERWEARVGQLAVYPGHGVVRIEELRDQEIAGESREFLVLRILDDESRILVPWENVDQVGLRAVIKRKEAARIWEILRAHPRPRRGGVTWSRRFREYRETLKKGSVFEIAEVLRDLLRLQTEKELSFGERRVLDTACSLLVHELAAAQKTAAKRIEEQIRDSVR
jgi:CarD family transcriptional regulator